MSLQDDIFDMENFFETNQVPDSYEAQKSFDRIMEKLNDIEQEADQLRKENKALRDAFKALRDDN